MTYSDLTNYFSIIFSIEWRPAAQKNVEDDPNAPDVTLFSVVWSEDLRRYVVGSPEGVAQLHSLTVDQKLCRCSKVDHFDYIVILRVEKEILRFQIPMSDAIAVAIGDSREYLLHYFGCILLVELGFVRYLVKQLTACAKSTD